MMSSMIVRKSISIFLDARPPPPPTATPTTTTHRRRRLRLTSSRTGGVIQPPPRVIQHRVIQTIKPQGHPDSPDRPRGCALFKRRLPPPSK